MLRDPLSLPVYFFGLELVFLACFVLTIRDAIGRYRRGERYAVFQWLVVFAYGVAMELLAFNAYPDYEHGRFSVALYHQKLPLYVTFVYVVFHYTGLQVVAARGLRPLAAALVTGLAILLLDVPFDIVGVDARWWTWHPSSHDVAQRWLGVPLTSYEWYLLFGAILAWLVRALRPRIERRPLAAYVALAPLVAVAVIVLGILGFLPFHALEAVGLPDGVLVAAHAALALAVALRARSTSTSRIPGGLVAIPLLLATWHVAVLTLLWSRGEVDGAPGKLAVIAAASAAMGLLFLRHFFFSARIRLPLGLCSTSASPSASSTGGTYIPKRPRSPFFRP
jgi:hypothetical protein